MKQRFLLVCLIAISYLLSDAAQTPDIAFSVNIAEQSILDQNTAKILQTKLERVINNNGVESDTGSAIFLTATVSPLTETTIEGGIRKINSVSYELSLEVLEPILGKKFATFSVTLNGAGVSTSKALLDAIRKIQPDNSNIGRFISEAAKKVENYYAANFETILAKARTLSKNHENEAAIALLWSIPTSPDTAPAVYELIETIFQKIQTEECENILQKARNAFALRSFDEATDWLNAIDATGPCGEEAKQLSAKIKTSVIKEEEKRQRLEAEREKREAIFAENQRKRDHELKKQTITAISGIARAYLNSKRQTTYYIF